MLSKDNALRPKSKDPVEIVIASKRSYANFFQKTLTGKSLINRFTSDVRLNLFSDNSSGLPEVYNKFIDQQKKGDKIIIFLHDDVYIHDVFWTQK